jgi:hypothetical protein
MHLIVLRCSGRVVAQAPEMNFKLADWDRVECSVGLPARSTVETAGGMELGHPNLER